MSIEIHNCHLFHTCSLNFYANWVYTRYAKVSHYDILTCIFLLLFLPKERLLLSLLPAHIAMEMKAEIIQRLQGPKSGHCQLENTNNFHNLYVKRHTNVRYFSFLLKNIKIEKHNSTLLYYSVPKSNALYNCQSSCYQLFFSFGKITSYASGITL